MKLTSLSSSYESCVSLAVLPVDIQIRTLSQRYDNIHVTLVTCNQEPCLGFKKKKTGQKVEMEELKLEGMREKLKSRISKIVQREKKKK